MIILETILLILGLLISISTINKKKLKGKFNFKKLVSILYLLICLISIIIMISKRLTDKKSNLNLFSTLSKIQGSVDIQSDSINFIISKTITLNNKLDSINAKTEKAIIQREQSQKIFVEQNKMLQRANTLTEKQLIDGKPFIEAFTHNVTLNSIDSTKTEFKITFTNTKVRPAKNFIHDDLLIFKLNERNDYFLHYHYPTDSLGIAIVNIEPVTVTHIIDFPFKEFLKYANESLIRTTVQYQDEVLNEKICYDIVLMLKVKGEKVSVVMEQASFKKIINDYINNNKINVSIKK